MSSLFTYTGIIKRQLTPSFSIYEVSGIPKRDMPSRRLPDEVRVNHSLLKLEKVEYGNAAVYWEQGICGALGEHPRILK
jgi:hypothetical protein